MFRKSRLLALVVLLGALAVPAWAMSNVTPAKLNAICRADYAATKAWSRSVPPIRSDEDMAMWETGIARHFTFAANDLRKVGAPRLGSAFARVAAGHRGAAVAYLSGSMTRVDAANARLRAVSTDAMAVARRQQAGMCVAFIKDFRP